VGSLLFIESLIEALFGGAGTTPTRANVSVGSAIWAPLSSTRERKRKDLMVFAWLYRDLALD
jgi:hypothetical protein